MKTRDMITLLNRRTDFPLLKEEMLIDDVTAHFYSFRTLRIPTSCPLFVHEVRNDRDEKEPCVEKP